MIPSAPPPRLAMPLIALLALGMTSCAAIPPEQDAEQLTVFAAASLKAPFTVLAEDFEANHPGVEVLLNFAGSSGLATQITEGASADVFASADTANMNRLNQNGLIVGNPQNFATNVLAIAVAPGNPTGIASFQDLTDPTLDVVVCAPQVPCGAATEKVERATGTILSPVSEENAVTDVLGKVVSGQADAGVVYTTDVQGAGDKVEGVDFTEARQAVNAYPVVAVAGTEQQDLTDAFVRAVLSEQGQAALAKAGFGAP